MKTVKPAPLLGADKKNKTARLFRDSVVLLLLCCGVNNLWAFDWEILPSVGIEVSHTDNVYLTKDEKEDIIYRATPGIQLSGEGRRVSLDIDYLLRITGYAEHDNGDETTNILSSTANIEFINNLLFLDLSANIWPRAISTSGVIDPQQLGIIDNYSEAMTTSVSPYIDTLLGGDVRLLLRYTFSTVTYDESALDDSESETTGVLASISSAPSVGRVSWAIDYSGRDVNYNDRSADARLEQVEGSLTITPTHGWAIIALAGYESNDYETAALREDTEGEIYGLGIQWQPVEATRLNIMGRNRYFGDTVTVEFEHDSGKTAYTLDYMERYNVDALAESGEAALVGQNIGSISSGVFLQKRVTLGIDKRFIRSNLIFEIQGDERDYQRSDGEERILGIRLQWDRRLTQRTDILFEGSLRQTEFASSDREDELLNAIARISHRFGRRTTGALEYNHLSRDSTLNSAEYQRNLFTAGVRIDF